MRAWLAIAATLVGCKMLDDRKERGVRDDVLDALRRGDAARLAEVIGYDVDRERFDRCAIDWAHATQVSSSERAWVQHDKTAVDVRSYRLVFDTPVERVEVDFETDDHHPTTPDCFRLPRGPEDGFATRPRALLYGNGEVHFGEPADWYQQSAVGFGEQLYRGPEGLELYLVSDCQVSETEPCPLPAKREAGLREVLARTYQGVEVTHGDAMDGGIEATVVLDGGQRRGVARYLRDPRIGRFVCLGSLWRADGDTSPADGELLEAVADLCRHLEVTDIGAP